MRRSPLTMTLCLLVGPGLLAGVAGPACAEPWLGQTVWVAPDIYTGATTAAGETDQAEALFAAARQAAAEGRLSAAFELASKTLHANPQHESARTVLGYELVDGEWVTPYQARQQRRGFRWSPRFGWLAPDEAPRYEAGERRLGRRWMGVDEDAAAHAAIDDGWVVRTDHFAVTTNDSLETGARLAAELEGLFQVWRQWFAGYWLEEREVRALFAGDRSARRRARPMQVFYHRDKAGYVDHLRRRQPRIGETLGIYFDDAREAHFFAPPAGASAEVTELAQATLNHEAAHQLFAENGGARRGAGRDANFWLVEGVACYFEMLARAESPAQYTLGHPAQGRLPSAVARGPVLPLVELAAMGQSDLQRRDDLAALYAESAGLVAMLRHGKHANDDREALVRTLRAVYGGRPDGGELERQTGRSADELDRQYRRFLANLSR
ncbi:hypothetical protein Pla108_36400 [Botrimarina colliarenosi]|uniref:DUF1570 domain-containing protein n=1 Tax=Botrimarina colliarenosi TaxID=2528001 RepID=A0A5C6A5Y4_9BACT|nr:DUF1570 domain-containing protein [Botrimarina colliarenosi]TWT94790.1 hypothetical protein Pla108_36400 [Botrimarina colliarenosi]